MRAPVEHELHRRRLSRNVGLGLVLGALVAIVFGLSVAKIQVRGDLQGFDHVPASAAPEALR